MFIRLVADSFSRRPRHKLLTGAALALGMAVATAALSVSLDVGDRLAHEFRSLGANLLVTPQADTLPLEIGGVDYRPVNEGSYLPEADLGKLKTIFWRNNIVGFAPVLEVPVQVSRQPLPLLTAYRVTPNATLIGTWSHHELATPDGEKVVTGIENTNPSWQVEGRWFDDGAEECVVGRDFAKKNGLLTGDRVFVYKEWPHEQHVLRVAVLLSTGGPEDDAIVAPLGYVQRLAGKPGVYRRLYVSALTKPEDDFARRDPAKMSPEEYDRWYCSPYISSIALQIE